jgi:hypothetical protein
VTLTVEGEEGVGPRPHRAVYPSGDVHAEEREARVGNGIDVPAHRAGDGAGQLVRRAGRAASTRSGPAVATSATGQPMRIDPPAPSTSAARAWQTAVKSMTPVDGDHSAATPVAAGSRSRSSPASIRRPCYAVGGRPLGQVYSRPSSWAPVATTSLPFVVSGMPRFAGVLLDHVLASLHRRAFSDPGP